MTMNSYELILLVRDMVGFPAPKTGGNEPLSDGNILKWINQGYHKLEQVINGVPAYLEFTVTAGGVIAVTKTNSDPVVASGDIVQYAYDFTYVKFPNVKAYGTFENLTDSIYKTEDRLMRQISRYDRRKQAEFQEYTGDYYLYYDLDKKNGVVFLPKTIAKTNTIGIHYRQKVADLHSKVINDTVEYTQAVPGSGLDDMTISGQYTGSTALDVRIEIDGVGSPNTFRLSLDGGATWATSTVPITGVAQTYGTTGIYITFAATTGHTAGDYWDFSVWPNEAPNSFFDDDDMMGYPCNWAAYNCALLLGYQNPGNYLAAANAAINEFREKHRDTSFGPSPTLWTIRDI